MTARVGLGYHGIMRSQLMALMKESTADNYRALHSLVVQHASYAPYGNTLEVLEAALSAGDFDLVAKQLPEAMPNLLLSPRVHKIAWALHRHTQDEQAAGMEMALYTACVEGMLATGDGSQARPYLVCHISDEYDLLRHLKREVRQQRKMVDGSRHFDVVACADGGDVWFDVTAAASRLEESLGGTKG